MGKPKERLDPWKEDIDEIQAFLHLQRYDYAAKKIDGRVLDLGCGLGYGSKMLFDADDKTVATDISDEALLYAKGNYDGPAYIRADNQILPFRNASFDGVVALEIIEHVDSGIQLLREICRVLRNEGILILSIPNLAHLGNRLRALLGKNPASERSENPYHKHEYRYEDIVELLRLTGFAVEDKWGQVVTFPFVHKLPPRICANTGRFLPKLSLHAILKARKKR